MNEWMNEWKQEILCWWKCTVIKRDAHFVFNWFEGGALKLKVSVWSFETVDSISEGIPSVWL